MDAELIETLNDIGIALSNESDIDRLLERILTGAKDITNADAGTLYSLTADNELRFEIVLNDSLGLAMGGATNNPIALPSIPLYDTEGRPDTSLVVVYAAIHNFTVNISDAYTASDRFDFSGTRVLDRDFGYRSQSFLTVPLTDANNRVIGVFQLINARKRDTGVITAFSSEQQRLVESLASQASVALERHRLALNKSRSNPSISVYDDTSGERSLFSSDQLISLLELCTFSAKAAHNTATDIFRYLVDNRLQELSSSELDEITYQAIKNSLGVPVAQRLRVWNRFRQSRRPLFVLIGGASGTGKSTMSTELALRLGIERIHSTDTLREVMRLLISEAIAPALHSSSYDAWKSIFDGYSLAQIEQGIMMVEGYKTQARKVSVSIDGVLRRAREERASCIVEGVHLYPAYMNRIPSDNDALVIPMILAVPDRRHFESYFKTRSSQAPRRAAQRYLKHVENIWRLQAYFLSEAQRYRVPVIPNIRRSHTLRQMLSVVSERLELEYTRE